MSNIIKLKRGSGSDPSASDLVVGEVALRTDSGKLFTKKDNGNVVEIGGSGISDGDKGDITVSNSGDTFTIDNGVVTSAKIADGTIDTEDLGDLILTNAKVATNAAIAGTKISPDFGSQNIETTGDIKIDNINKSLQVGDITNDNYVQISQENVSSGTAIRGFTTTYNNASVLENLQGGLNQHLVLGDGGINDSGTIFGISITQGGAIYTRLNLTGTGDLAVQRNITLGGTVDGRNIATDGSKLDGIEPGATADQSASEILTLLKTVDGVGSGLDADTLDGVQVSGLVAVGGDTMTGGLRIDKGNSADGIMGEAYSGYFGLKHSDQLFNSEYMILSQDNHTYISATTGSNVYIRGGGNSTTNQMIVSSSGTTIGGNSVLTSASSLNASNISSGTVAAARLDTATTQSAGNNTTRIATTAFVSTAINNLINGAPAALDTLNELAAAMNDNASFSTTVTNSLATKMPLAGGEFTGNITFSGSQTVDGRDLSVDGSKLDGIESGATADQTKSDIDALNINADTVDSLHASSFLRSDANDSFNNTLTWSGTAGNMPVDFATNDGYPSMRVIRNNASSSSPKSDGLYIGYSNSNNGVTRIYGGGATNGELSVNGASDVRINGSTVFHAGNDGSGSGLDADTLDGVQGSSYLRSDADDTTTGNLVISNKYLRVGRPVSDVASMVRTNTALEVSSLGVDHTASQTNVMRLLRDGTSGVVYAGAADFDLYRHTASGVRPNVGLEIKLSTSDTSNYYSALKLQSNGVIETGGNTIWHSGNDGAGSGLDADTLDGQQGSYYLDYDNFSNTPTIPTNNNQLTNGAGYLTSVATSNIANDAVTYDKIQNVAAGRILGRPSGAGTGGLNSLTAGEVRTIINVENGATADQTASEILTLIKTVDGSGSGLDADTLDGSHATSFINTTSSTQKKQGALRVGNSSNDLVISFDGTRTTNSVGHTASNNEGIFWHTGADSYGIYRTSGTWSSPNFQQLKLDWPTGIILDGGDAYGKSGVRMESDFLPVTDSTYDIGASANRFANGYFDTLYGNGANITNVNATTLDSIDSGSFLRSDADDVATHRIRFENNATDNEDDMATSTGSLGCIEIKNMGAGNDAFMAFHGGQDFAFYLGLNADINDLAVGGWSMGANKYRVWHAGNDGSGSGLDSDTVDGIQASSFVRSDADDSITGHLTITNDSGLKIYTSTNAVGAKINFSDQSSRGQNGTLTYKHSDGAITTTGGNSNDGWIFEGSETRTVVKVVGDIEATNQIFSAGGTMSGELQVNGRLDVGDGGSSDHEIRIYKGDNNVADHIQFYNGTTRVGEIGVEDTTWLRINQETAKNIYTPRYIRADGGFFVDGTSKGINGSGNFIGGTIAGASDYGTLLRSDADDNTTGKLLIGGTYSNNSYNSVSTTRLLFGGGNDIENYHIGTSLENFGGNYSKLDLRWHTGIRMGAQAVYGGIRFYTNEDLGTVIFSVNKGDGNTRIESGELYHNTSGTSDKYWREGNDGSGSGLDADTLDGMQPSSLASTNTIVQRNGNGYVFANYFNTTANDTGTGADVTRFYCSEDAYIRYIDKASMRSVMNVTARSGAFGGRETVTTDTNYWVGSMGWGSVNFDTTVWDYGSGFIDVWNNPSGQPSGTSHWQAIQSMHYSNGSGRYGFRIACGAGNPSSLYVQGRWNTTTNGWYKLWNEANDGSGSGLDSDTVDGIQASSFLRSDTADTASGDITFSGGGGAVTIAAHSDIRFTNGNWTGNAYGKIQQHSNYLYIAGGTNGIILREDGTDRWIMDGSGHLRPSTNNTYDIGTSSYRVRNIYVNDAHFSNEGSQNSVDGSWGDWTLQEGENDIFMINNRSGKKFKIAMIPV